MICAPKRTNEAFIHACHGEQTYIAESSGYGPHVVLPRSLMKFSRRLNGVVQPSCTIACAMKNWTAVAQSIAASAVLLLL